MSLILPELVKKLNKGGVSGLASPCLTFVDERGMPFQIPIREYKVTEEYVDLKKPKSLVHKFTKDQKAGLHFAYWNPDPLKTMGGTFKGGLGVFGEHIMWGTVNEMEEGWLRFVPSPKRLDLSSDLFSPETNRPMTQLTQVFMRKKGLTKDIFGKPLPPEEKSK